MHDHNDCNRDQCCPDSDDNEDEQNDAFFDYSTVFDCDLDAFDVSDDGTNSQINPTSANSIISNSDDDEIEYEADDTAVAKANSSPAAVNVAQRSFPPPRLLASSTSPSAPPARPPSSRYMDPNNHSIARQTHLPSAEWIEEGRGADQGFTRLRHSKHTAIDVVVSSNRLNKAKEKLHPDSIQHCMTSATTCICAKTACYHQLNFSDILQCRLQLFGNTDIDTEQKVTEAAVSILQKSNPSYVTWKLSSSLKGLSDVSHCHFKSEFTTKN